MVQALILLVSASKQQKAENPLLSEFQTPHQTPPFDRIEIAHYEPAFDEAIAQARKEITDIVASAEEPEFENTIAALDRAGELLNTVSSVFFNLNSACTSEAMQEIAQRISPKLTEYSNSIYMNPDLFQRVKQVYDRREQLGLTPEQSTLLEDTWKAFVKGGANLTGDARKRFQEITTELSRLSLKFEENILAETNGFTLHVTDKGQLSGLPEDVLETAAQQAREKGKTGWLFTLHAPVYVPFMKYADNRELREKMFRAYGSRGNRGNRYDNKEIIRQMTALRLEKARLLGYATYAEYVLGNRMAQTPENVNNFLHQLLEASHPHA
ncbi:MAG: M3 family peptidase, partial [Odoribacter sp.]|nr:M3 family peptidase [Odoribacter sp.]